MDSRGRWEAGPSPLLVFIEKQKSTSHLLLERNGPTVAPLTQALGPTDRQVAEPLGPQPHQSPRGAAASASSESAPGRHSSAASLTLSLTPLKPPLPSPPEQFPLVNESRKSPPPRSRLPFLHCINTH